MVYDTLHIGSLLGRVFIISKSNHLNQWYGCRESSDVESDYDLLNNILTYDEGDLVPCKKSESFIYFGFFSISSKIEIFKIDSGFILLDGLYLNESWNYSNKIDFTVVKDMKLSIEIQNDKLVVIDAAIDGSNVFVNSNEGIHNIGDNVLSSYSTINMHNGIYSVKKISANILKGNNEIVLNGLKISTS